jgi:hypothetical protein
MVRIGAENTGFYVVAFLIGLLGNIIGSAIWDNRGDVGGLILLIAVLAALLALWFFSGGSLARRR